jgi:RNA polymerase sigma factor (TIGR02999 family)
MSEPADEETGDAARRLTLAEVFPVVYEELRRAARHERYRLRTPDTMMTTALVNEAYLRLIDNPAFGSRGEFLRIAAVAMRRILVDRVRAQLAAKRGAGAEHVELDEVADFVVADEQTTLGVDEALKTLATVDPRLVEIVECRFFAGYSDAETALALGISERSVQRHWVTARAWLREALRQA